MSKRKRRKVFLELYGKEWEAISRRAKSKVDYTCQDCGKVYSAYYLDAHHIIPISHFKKAGYKRVGPVHKCFGIMTSKPWHVEGNIRVLCMECHAKLHPHLEIAYRNGKRSKAFRSRRQNS